MSGLEILSENDSLLLCIYMDKENIKMATKNYPIIIVKNKCYTYTGDIRDMTLNI
ncbi:Uncharacterized protein dnm_052410 [Desulfonema magnum]|uniref:Uncharacterized protein n=1 Tax=Desulfonema magnum TaxID=45655 RepID=A0A975BPA7_9BACT|nr:Uncharacterized protein dnm_052410 [Desulfonema magnum]